MQKPEEPKQPPRPHPFSKNRPEVARKLIEQLKNYQLLKYGKPQGSRPS